MPSSRRGGDKVTAATVASIFDWDSPVGPCTAELPGQAAMSMLEATIGMAKAGTRLFPCNSQKKPLTKTGFKEATTDESIIRAWWSQWPDAAIGIPTGAINSIVVLDVDKDDDKFIDGVMSLKSFPELPPTRTVRTPRGGKHFYFKHPGGIIKNSTSKIGPGLDIRGDGGYVIAPPSRNGNGQDYSVKVNGPIANLPKWLEIMIVEPVRQSSPQPAPAQNAGDIPARAKVEGALHCISANCSFDDWLRIGMALHSWSPSEGRTLWDSWSQTAPERYQEAAIGQHWKTFKHGAVTIATLFKMAIDNGWKPLPRKSPEKSPAANQEQPLSVSADLQQRYGPPFFIRNTEFGAKYDGLNEPFWAGLHSSEHRELFEPTERAFYRYNADNGLFSEVTTDTLKREVAYLLLDYARKYGTAELQKERSDHRLNSIVGQLRGITEQRDAFTKRPRAIHLQNGVIVFRDGDADLVRFSPDFRSRNQSPIMFDPTAQCPRFLDELVRPAVHADDVIVIQKYMGLCLLARNLIQRFLILDGEAGRGKSQLANVFQLIVGQINATQLRTEHLADRFEVFRFLRKTLLIGVDVPPNFLSTKGASVLKALVGGDFLDAERKGSSECFPVEGNFCVLVTSNTKLRVRLEGDTGAWRRRMIIVRYEAPPPKRKIPDFAKGLVEAEGAGILNWALQGLAALLRDVDEIGDIRLTDRQAGMVNSLLAESDSLRAFLLDRIIRDPDGDLTVQEVVEAYAEYCPTKGWNPLPITVIQRQLEGLMLELFQTVKTQSIERNNTHHRGFRNVRFK